MHIIKKVIKEFNAIIHANHIIANYPNVKAKNNRVNLWELDLCEHYGDNRFRGYNLGDYLARVVVEFMLKRKDLSLNSPVTGIKYLNSIGSNLLLSYQNATIWGSGIEREYPGFRNLFHTYPVRRLDIRAVRGPLTRYYLERLGHRCPKVYGDPAILMPLIYTPPPIHPKFLNENFALFLSTLQNLP